MAVEIAAYSPVHLAAMTGKWRKADVDELWAIDHATPEQCVENAIHSGGHTFTALLDGAPIAIFGVTNATLLGSAGVPWLVGTDALNFQAKNLLVIGQYAVLKFLTVYETLFNLVDSRNTKAIRWLKHLGFKVGEAYPCGPEGQTFHLFYMRRTDVQF